MPAPTISNKKASALSARSRRTAAAKTVSKSTPPPSRAAKPTKLVKPARKTSTTKPGTIPKVKITNYTTGLKWLYEHIDHERARSVKYDDTTFNLNRMKKLLAALDNPQNEIPCVQVAGTKGKGSTCAMLSSMLQGNGYTIGQFSSPHLIDLRERITIDGQMIAYNDCAEIFKQIALIEKKLPGAPLSFFEIMTGAALRYFADQAVDIAVLETGLGGRLDSVTAVTPIITAMTRIGLDHTDILGKDVVSIAREKAGIFKPGVVALSVEQEPEVAEVLQEMAEKAGTEIFFCGKDIDFSYRFEANKELGPHTRVCVNTERSKFDHLPVPLKGEHQAFNCGLALSILDRLKLEGFEIEEQPVVRGLAATQIDGRMEQVWGKPRVIIDGAHNPDSIQGLIKGIGAHISYDSMVMIFGCAQDKEIEPMLEQVGLGADKVIFTKAKNNPRACDPNDLLKKFTDICGKMAQVGENLEDALRLADAAVSRDDLIVVTGSFYLAGETKKYFIDLAAKRAK